MLTLTQHVSCCYSESEMKAEGEGQWLKAEAIVKDNSA